MTYADLQLNYGFSDFLTGETIIDSAVAEDNINGDGKLSFSWRQNSGGSIPMGTTIQVASKKYMMMQTYVPTANADGSFNYSPSFGDYSKLAEKTVFSMAMQTQDGESITLYTFPYTGTASTLITALNASLQAQLGMSVTVDNSVDMGKIISVSIDGESVKSVCDKVASALGTNAYYSGNSIVIGTSAYSADTYYNRFIVLGGTRNMGKKLLKSDGQVSYAQVTQRLGLYASGESVIDRSGSEPPMTKILIFDDIYPKMEMVITSVASRECYCLNESGERIKIGGTDESPIWKTYTKWYITLGVSDGEGGTTAWTEVGDVIEGQPLGIQFTSGILKGREFDLAYFDTDTNEQSDDDVSISGYEAAAGSFRIIMVADGATLLPNVSLCPAVGDTVTPINVAMQPEYYAKARTELAERADPFISLYMSKKPAEMNYTDDMMTAVQDFLLPHSQESYIAGQPYPGDSSYIVTGVTTNLIDGSSQVTFGTFKKKGLLSSLVDKVEGAQISGGSATVGEGDQSRKTAPMGIDQFNALREAGGALGMKNINTLLKEHDEAIETFGTDISAIEAQADKSFDIHFYAGAPTPSLTVNTTSGPSSEWTTDDAKEQHLYDICYDTTRDAGSTGGRAYRWLRVALNGQDEVVVDSDGNPVEYDPDEHVGSKWCWVEITDLDTRATLEKIADVASDGILTAGTEKVRILADWKRALNEYTNYYANQYGVSTSILTAFKESFAALAKMLNDDVAWVGTGGALPDPVTVPNWINAANISHDTVLSEKSYEDGEGVTHTVTSAYYNARWDTWYAALAQLLEAATGEVKNVADSKMRMFVQVDLPSAPYKVGDMWHKLEQAGHPEGDNYLCIQECTGIGDDQPSMSHWMIQDSNKDMMSITNVLGELGTAFPGQAAKYGKDCKVTLKDGSTAPSGATSGDLWYNGNSISEYKPPYTGQSAMWQQITNAEGLAAFKKIASLIGLDDEVFYFRQSMSGESAVKYDIYSVVSMYRDAITNQDVSAGGASVWVYDGTVWQHVIDNVVSMIQNLGKHIVLAVFGQNDGSTNYAGQIAVSPKMTAMVNEAINNETSQTTAIAAIKTILETELVNGQRVLTGRVKIDSDYLDFRGKKVEFTGESTNNLNASVVLGFLPTEWGSGLGWTQGSAIMSILGGSTEFIAFGVKPIFGGWDVVAKILGTLYTNEVASKAISAYNEDNGQYEYGVTGTFENGNGNTIKVINGIIVDGLE